MKLWGGRFTKETNQLVHNFNASISFDQKFYKQDIEGSIAHVTMLEKQGIINQEEKDQIISGLSGILEDIMNGSLVINAEHEDIHSFVEAHLIERIGEAGKKLHTGRSRNDQVATDMKLYTRDEIYEIDALLKDLLQSLQEIMRDNTDTFMPGFTHLQKAQPVTLAHHIGAYFEMFKRDRQRLTDIIKRMNLSPLGSGALAGTTYPLDREYTATLLGFDGPTLNSMDSVSDRDYLIELLSALSTIMMHLSRFSEEIIIWNSNEYRFIELDDAYSTGSSIMPQKKNPDIAELVRGKTGRVYGALISLLTTMKGLPLAYNKDMQEDKELTFDAIDTVKGCLALFTGMVSTMQFNKTIMAGSAKNGFTNATDAADYLVNKGVAFRDAHGIVGQLVLTCIEKNISLDEMSLEDYKNISPVFEEDIYEAISLTTCVNKRNTIGAPGLDAMNKIIQLNDAYLEQ
ncbi:argininosuccinate lyase [Mobilitalea sibirica]|uniref:Argininosuccinate lyase n=1 Tax=Mobilitalea sibirica TaxID=1462919 RepID=A0A8J7L2I3_9FIRM|nr:argininosuccinate lyase [Mobilitalea sibirica]MBH1940673.1 argininosuccinate lyase [Mobilitalea sibirica]